MRLISRAEITRIRVFIRPKRECHMQRATCRGRAQGMKPQFKLAVVNIFGDQKWRMGEHLLCFGLANAMFIDTFSGVAPIPLKAYDSVQLNHVCISDPHQISGQWRMACPGRSLMTTFAIYA